MSKEKRYLIATADERTWKFDRPVVFLGEWCRLHDRKHIWESMDALIAEPYGLASFSRDADYAEARQLEARLFPLLCGVLNDFHKVDFDERCWKILIGHWFRRCLDVLLNRFKTLDSCFENYRISGISIRANDLYSLAPLDSYSAIWAFNDDRWNESLNFRMIKFFKGKDFSMEIIGDSESQRFTWDMSASTSTSTSTSTSLKRDAISCAYKWFSYVGRLFLRDDDAFIVNTYLPKKQEMKLQVALGQWPQLWGSSKMKVTEGPNPSLRESLSKKIASDSCNKCEVFIREILFDLIPVCYLEGFENLGRIVDQQAWPKKPKFIFTSNNFDFDEVFKLWVAIKVRDGFKYFTGQHGNNYGTSRYLSPSVEEIVSDKFLTWGWDDGLTQHTPAFIFKTAGCKTKQHDSNGSLLLIEVHLNVRLTTWDSFAEFGLYFDEQQNFVKALNHNVKKELIVRLHSAHKYYKWNEYDRWITFDSSLKIDSGVKSIGKLISKSRLVVHSYDSTGILETLSQNIPTLAFWQNGLDHIRESAKPYYQLLVDAGIVHFTAESVAKKVNDVWDNVDSWWMQADIQAARKEFCNRYARVSHTPIADLKKSLIGLS